MLVIPNTVLSGEKNISARSFEVNYHGLKSMACNSQNNSKLIQIILVVITQIKFAPTLYEATSGLQITYNHVSDD